VTFSTPAAPDPAVPRVRTLLYYLATSGYDAAERQRRLDAMAPFVPAGYRLAFATAAGGPEFLDQAADFGAASRAAAAGVEALGPDQGEAILLGGALDPGLAELRTRARLPVIGPGEAALFVAALHRRPLVVLVQDDAALEAGHRLVHQTPVKPPVIHVRSLGVPVRALVADLDRGRQALWAAARAALSAHPGAALYLGSMSLPTLGLTDELRAQLGVPILDPLRLGVRLAVEAVEAVASRAGGTGEA
jgi:allantoin racemase